MRFTTLLLFILLLPSTASAAIFDGYYVGLRGDTVNCKFDVPILSDGIHHLAITEEIRVIHTNRKRKRYKAGQIKSFVLIGGPIREKFVTVKIQDKYFFLKEEIDGKLKLYKHFFHENDGSSNSMQYVVKLPFQAAVTLNPIRFRKQLLRYTENDAFFATQLSDRTWKYDMIDKLVTEYNSQVN